MITSNSTVLFLRKLLSGIIIFSLLLPTSFINVEAKVFFLEADYYQDKAQERKITIGKGEIISSDKAFKRIAISGPNIADLQVLNEKQIFLRAKNLGLTTFLAWEKDSELPTRYDILVLPDIESLTDQLKDLDESILVKYIPPSTSLSSMSGGSGFSSTDVNSETSSAPSTDSIPALPSQGGAGSGGDEEDSFGAGKIILTGEVQNAEVIARALQIAGAYVGDQGIKIISQPGGQVVDGLAGEYDIHNNSDGSGGAASGGGNSNSSVSFGSRDAISFTSNRYANLSRGVIATTQNGTVVSFLSVKNPPQISVAIRFYEVQRNIARNLGINATFGGHTLQGGSFVGGNGLSMLIGGIASISKLNAFMAGESPEFTFGPFGSAGGSFLGQSPSDGVTGALFYPKNGVGALIQALLERGEIKSLAEPTLVITNGEPASFLAGGEVPIVRSVFTAGGASQDITYEPFGIRFTLLPTVTKEDNIHLQLVPEIRDIDTELSNFVVPPGSTQVRPPAFRTRRTQTQVELKPGQAFAISGLLREDNTRNLRKVPGIGDIPLLGGLFRSKSFSNGETELLIVVSPQIVRAAEPDKIAKLSTMDIPYDEFNQFAPLRPYIKIMDEVGPGIDPPLDAGKYNQVVGYNNLSTDTADLALPLNSTKSQLNIKQDQNKDKISKQVGYMFPGDKTASWLDIDDEEDELEVSSFGEVTTLRSSIALR